MVIPGLACEATPEAPGAAMPEVFVQPDEVEGVAMAGSPGEQPSEGACRPLGIGGSDEGLPRAAEREIQRYALSARALAPVQLPLPLTG